MKVSVFWFPDDPGLRAEWIRLIRWKDYSVIKNCCLWEAPHSWVYCTNWLSYSVWWFCYMRSSEANCRIWICVEVKWRVTKRCSSTWVQLTSLAWLILIMGQLISCWKSSDKLQFFCGGIHVWYNWKRRLFVVNNLKYQLWSSNIRAGISI